MKKIIFFLAISLFLIKGINAQKLPTFDADLGKKTIFGQEIRIPYLDVISYFGFIKTGSTPDEERGGKKYYYLYLWIPTAIPELGIRMVSPVPKDLKPEKLDYVMDEYNENSSDKKSYFDTWISFERSSVFLNDSSFVDNVKNGSWTLLGQNDDSGELPKQPSGNKYNSLMRISSDANNPTKSLVKGLYRIGFTTFKTGDVQGSFIAQIGAVVKIPGTIICKNLDGLKAILDSK
ncbi:MAG: LipL32 family surface lipoprotein [Ignavibacteriae bacterium]|nr:LipL32 family surface lipoprotein [Ignavibacteriota bacterium]